MMNKTKRIISLLLLFTFVFSLMLFCASCHGRRALKEFVMPETFNEDKTYEITFWAKNESDATQTAVYRQAIDAFEALYPNISVNMRIYNDYSRIYQDVITNISTSTTPNVCITYPDHIATYITGTNIVVPLDGLISDERYGLGGSALKFDSPDEDEVIAKFLAEGQIDGVQYALPYMRSTEACYVNKTYVEKLGFELPKTLTWEFIWEVAEKALEKNEDGTYKVNGGTVMIPVLYKSADNLMIQLLAQMGGEYSTDDGDILIFNDTTAEVLTDFYEHYADGEFSTHQISASYPGDLLNAGQCIFGIDSTAGASWIGSHASKMDISGDKVVEFETAVMAIPQLDPDNPTMISQGPSVCVFNKEDPDEVLASWLFAQFLLTDDVQIAYAKTEGYIPVTSKAHSNEEYIDYLSRAGEDNSTYYDVKIAATRLLLDNIDNTFITPVFNGSASLRNAAGDMVYETAKAYDRRQTVDEAFFEALYNRMISKYSLKINNEEEQ